MKQKIEMLKKNKKMSTAIILVLIVVIGFAFAYLGPRIMAGFNRNTDIISHTTDMLLFTTNKDLALNVNQFNLTEGGENLSDSSVGTASLKANSTNNTASFTYNVYFQVNMNNYIYTTEDRKAEMILTITDPTGAEITNLTGLDYITVGDVSGFDITTATSLYQVAMDYPISSNSSTVATEQDWTFKITFINLETNQKENANKILSAEIIMSQNVYTASPNVIATAYANNVISTHMPLGNYNVTTDCVKGYAEWDYKTWGITVDPSIYSNVKCNINYDEKENKTYLNEYITTLAGTTQGDGMIVDEGTVSYDDSYYEDERFIQSEYNIVSNEGWAYDSIKNSWYVLNYSGATDDEAAITLALDYYDGYSLCYGGNYEVGSSSDVQLFSDFSSYLVVTINDENVDRDDIYGNNECIDLSEYDSINEIKLLYVTGTVEYFRAYFYLNKGDYVERTETTHVGIRYEGKDPNNYVWFNNELWRIIGVFDETIHGQSGEKLVKLLRIDSLGNLAWDAGLSKYWYNSSLKKILNGSYYDYETYGYDNNNCISSVWRSHYDYSSGVGVPVYVSVFGNCDFSNVFLKQKYRNMIHDVIWDINSSYLNTLNELFKAERTGTEKATGKIGLMYASDYAYSILAKDCNREYIREYDYNLCSSNSWMRGSGSQWTININLDKIIEISSSGVLSTETIGYGNEVRPTIYLNSNVYIISGNGSVNDPYILGM